MTDRFVIYCSSCDADRRIEDFYPGNRTHGSWCKPCCKKYMRLYRQKNKPRICLDCGMGCSGERCRSCRDVAVAASRPIPQPKPPKPILDPSTMTSKQIRNSAAMRILRRQVLEEETHCGICGEFVDKTIHHGDRLSATVDHIIPLALGGPPFDRNNVRLTHRSCNCAASNGQRTVMLVEQLSFARAAVWMGRFF